MTLLENATISLRAPEPEDLDILYIWENNPEIWKVFGTVVPFSRFVLKQYLDNAGKDIFETRQLRLIIQLNKGKGPWEPWTCSISTLPTTAPGWGS